MPDPASPQRVETPSGGDGTRPGRAETSGIWRAVATSAGAKVLMLPLSAILGIINTRIIIDNFGEQAYAQYGLLVAIGALLPFADLGISAAIMNAIGASDRPSRDARVHGVMVTSIRILIGSFLTLLVITAAISFSGLWPSILGQGLDPRTGPAVAAMCLALIATSLLFGFSQRVFIGLGLNHVSILIVGLQSPLVLGCLLIITTGEVPFGPYVAAIPYLVTLLIQIASTVIVSRRISPMLGRVVRDVPRLRTVRGGRVFDVAWPMLIQMVALPLAMQSDRIVLSHASSVRELAQYNMASQIFTPVWQVVSAAGMTLWPLFARLRATGASRSPVPMSFAFGGVAVLVCAVLAFASPLLSELASGGVVSLSPLLVLTFAVFMVFQSLKAPLGMFLTDAPGLRFQAGMIVLMLPINVGLSLALAGPLGAAGPVLGSLVGVAVFQWGAYLVFIRRRAT